MTSNRNPYEEDVDFEKLAQRDIDFAKFLKTNGQLDFSDPESVQQLTKALLKRDFNLNITLPPDRLCPPVPNRLNYIIWIQDLVDTSGPNYSDRYDPNREVVALDIGTGASCIYPLLGCATRPKWKYLATDIDELSLSCAQENIQANDLSSRIKPLKTSPNSLLIPLQILDPKSLITITLTNPPFYPSLADLLSSAAQKSRPPNTACTGSATEMIYPGGETAFVTRLIDESLTLRHRIQWYTSMLGKLSSVAEIITALKQHDIDNYAVTEFIQGSRTRRWGVAWSFGDERPNMKTARGGVVGHGIAKALLPFPSEYLISHSFPGSYSTGEVREDLGKRINAIIEGLDLQWRWKDSIATGVGFATRNVWRRAARRAVERGNASGNNATAEEEDDEEDEMAFGFKISVRDDNNEDEDLGHKVVVRWLKGHDPALFESFCGFLKRKLESR